MSVKIRLKMMGRKHRPFFRICATDTRSPRDGKVIEELGTYDPMLVDTDARAVLNAERVAYWLSVGAQPSETCRVLIKKYGANGTRLREAEAARAKLSAPKEVPPAPAPAKFERRKKGADEAAAEEAPAAEAPAEAAAEAPTAE
ncbi:MAG: 30S ribosomal protein S16 [Pirellulales bacterium]|nr:30S ribosomal protein S16 [Pirellulales bacterium]